MRDYKYYVKPYSKYNEDLKDWDKNSVKGLKETVNDLVDKASKFINIFSLWCGNVAEETKASLASQIEGMSKLRDNVNDNLSGAVDQLDLLKTDTSSLKTEEDDLIVKEEELQDVENNRVIRPINLSDEQLQHLYDNSNMDSVDSSDYKDANLKYQKWRLRRDGLKRTVLSKESSCQTIQSSCDTHISSIDEYNGSIDELNDSISTIFEEAFGIEDFDSLPPEEKEKYFQQVIDAMERDYYSLRDNYLSCPEGSDKLVNILGSLGIFTDIESFPIDLFTKYNVETKTYELNPEISKKLFGYCEEKNFLGALNSYLNGKGWEESGLSQFGVSEENFLDSISYDFDCNSKDELKALQNDLNSYYEIMKNSANNYDNNVQKLSLLNTSIYAARQYKKTIRYEGISNYPDFSEKSNIIPSEDDPKYQDWLYMKNYYGGDTKYALEEYFYCNYSPDEKLLDGYNTVWLFQNMSEEEVKVYSYLYNTSGKDSAATYLKNMADTINRRVGLRRANDFVEWIADTPNPDFKAWDDFADRANMFGKGFQNGLVSFTDGIHDLWDPSAVKEAFEYEDAAIISLMQSEEIRQRLGEDKVNALLKFYGWGDVAGENAIPAILNFVHPGLGDVTLALSTTGNTLEGSVQKNELLRPESQYNLVVMYLDAILNGGSKMATSKVFKKIDAKSPMAIVVRDFFKGCGSDVISQVSGVLLLDEDMNLYKVVGSGVGELTGARVGKIPINNKYVLNLMKEYGKSLAKDGTVYALNGELINDLSEAFSSEEGFNGLDANLRDELIDVFGNALFKSSLKTLGSSSKH